MVLGALLTLMGFQILSIGLYAKTLCRHIAAAADGTGPSASSAASSAWSAV